MTYKFPPPLPIWLPVQSFKLLVEGLMYELSSVQLVQERFFVVLIECLIPPPAKSDLIR